MDDNVVAFPHEKLRNYLLKALKSFDDDPADTPSQEGYQAALEKIYRVFFSGGR